MVRRSGDRVNSAVLSSCARVSVVRRSLAREVVATTRALPCRGPAARGACRPVRTDRCCRRAPCIGRLRTRPRPSVPRHRPASAAAARKRPSQPRTSGAPGAGAGDALPATAHVARHRRERACLCRHLPRPARAGMETRVHVRGLDGRQIDRIPRVQPAVKVAPKDWPLPLAGWSPPGVPETRRGAPTPVAKGCRKQRGTRRSRRRAAMSATAAIQLPRSWLPDRNSSERLDDAPSTRTAQVEARAK